RPLSRAAPARGRRAPPPAPARRSPARRGTRAARPRSYPSCAIRRSCAGARLRSPRAPSPSQEHLPLAAVRRKLVEDAAVLHQHETVEVLRQLTRLHVAEEDPVADG